MIDHVDRIIAGLFVTLAVCVGIMASTAQASATHSHVDVCTITPHHFVNCHTVITPSTGFKMTLEPQQVATWSNACPLSASATVDGKHGRWTEHHTLIVWRLDRTVFDGLSFTNTDVFAHVVKAHC